MAEAGDKFGKMGVVGVMLAEKKTDGIEIPIFVLSCRVFGFGIEYALLNALKKLAAPTVNVRGCFKETPHNEPSRRLYPASGFTQADGFWNGTIGNLPDAPGWLQCEYSVNRAARKPFSALQNFPD